MSNRNPNINAHTPLEGSNDHEIERALRPACFKLKAGEE